MTTFVGRFVLVTWTIGSREWRRGVLNPYLAV